MPDIIDSLLVSLGLDRSEFEKGKRDTDRDLDDMADKAKKRGGNVEDSAKKMGLGFAKLRGELTGLLLTFAGAKSITQFAENLVSATAAVGRSASVFGISTNNLNAMGDAIKGAGGNAAEATAVAGRIADIRANFIRHPEALNMPLMGQLGIHDKSAFDSMEGLQYTLADQFQKEMASAKGDPDKENDTRATFRQRVKELLGVSDEWVNMLEQGTPALREQIALYEKQDPVTEANAKAAQDLQRSMEHLEAALAGVARTGGVIEFLDGLAGVLDNLSGSAQQTSENADRLTTVWNMGPRAFLAAILKGMGFNFSWEDSAIKADPAYQSFMDRERLRRVQAQAAAEGDGGAGGGAPGTPNYDSVVGHVDRAKVSSMALGDLIQYGRRVLIPETRARGIGRDKFGRLLGSSAAGAYQITGTTIAQFAPQLFGPDWRKRTFDAQAQDELGEAIFNASKGGDLAAVWTSLHNHRRGAYASRTWEQMRAVLAAGEGGLNGGHIRVVVENHNGSKVTVAHQTGHGVRKSLANRHRVANSNTGMG